MNLPNAAQRVHFVGIGGIGVSALAKLLHHDGKIVSGSDINRNEAVEELLALGVSVTVGHDDANLPTNAELLVYSDAVPETNSERQAARACGLSQLSYFELLGELTRQRRTVAVSGTNGKSSTTSMLGLMLIEAGFDPTVIVGTKVRGFPDRNLRSGQSELLVVEACEHHANMLKLAPQVITLTNVEADHLDFYRDLEHVKETFAEYVARLPADGLLVVNGDDANCRDLPTPARRVTFGFSDACDYRAVNVTVADGRQHFELRRGETALGEFELPLPGRFNVANALAALVTALELGADVMALRDSLAAFPGVWRRFERVGERAGAPIFSDYGHHPTAVEGTLVAAREFFPERRVVLCFQPHQRNRTRNLFDDFTRSFDGADVLVLPEIYDVPGREADEDRAVSSLQLAEAVRRRDMAAGRSREVTYCPGLPQAADHLAKIIEPGDVVLIMGAGDVYRLAEKLCTKS